VSWVITLVRQQRAPPVTLHGDPRPVGADDTRERTPSLQEIAASWQNLLQVRGDANIEEIAAAYHQRLAECDQVRFSATAGSAERQAAERQRTLIDEAYNFIRTSRGGS
jgi:hypothetical protein